MSIDVFTGLINGFIPEPHAGLLNGILFGAKATLDPALKNQLIETGTLYILTLYGVKISLLVTFTGLLFRRFLSRPIANVASVVVIIGFIWLIGFTPGVLRAGIMATISLLAITFGRQKWPFLAWILAVTIMLLLHPPWFGDLSFQLSAMASLGIIVFGSKNTSVRLNKTTGPAVRLLPSDVLADTSSEPGKALDHTTNSWRQSGISWHWLRALDGSPSPYVTRLTAMLKFFWNIVGDDLRLSFSAQIFTIPIIMFQLHRISLIAPLTNVLIGWLILPILLLGALTVILGFVWWPLGQLVAWFAWVLLQYVILVVQLTARIPFASISW